MKHLKRMGSLLMALVMALTLVVNASAANNGSITINNVSEGNTYTIYKLLDLQSYNTETGAYSYKVNSAWTGFFETEAAKAYFTVDTQGYATWTNTSTADADVASFAKLAMAYANANNIEEIDSKTPTSSQTTLRFEELELGYYLIDSTMGALCGLTTTNPNAAINAKNDAPTIDKQVKEDSTNQWGDENSADIGQTVEFRATISVHAGAQNYVMHDKMSEGLTFGQVTSIAHKAIAADIENTVPVGMYEVVTAGLEDGCDFHIVFSDSFCNHLADNDKVIVYYTATLNEKAVIAGNGNPNETWLDFGEDHSTTHDSTITYTYAFDLVKTDGQNKLLDGAAFKIYDAETGGKEVAVVKAADGEYRRAQTGEDGVAIEVTNGHVRVEGFDNGTYYLEEITTPEGYNQLSGRQAFTISGKNLDAIIGTDNIVSTGSGVHVVNQSGTMLPETGGMGTTLFYVLGGVLVIGAGVALVTKKRMA